MLRYLVLVLMFVLGGCARQVEASGMASVFPEPFCQKIAKGRVADAAANGVDADMQMRIFRDSYDTCIKNRSAP
jgi:hypothetical protein